MIRRTRREPGQFAFLVLIPCWPNIPARNRGCHNRNDTPNILFLSNSNDLLLSAPLKRRVRGFARYFVMVDRSGSSRLTQISFNRHFALATPCAYVPGCYAELSNFKIGVAHPWSWAIGSSTSAAQRSFDYGR
jgi:hypothetical protein